jgi:nicotinamide phosphoribosyltransferase
MNFNICSASDSYKFQHWNMYPKDTEVIYSYLESRVGAKFDKTIFFGLQYFLKNYFTGKVVTAEKIAQAKKRIDGHLGPNAFNEAGWQYILDKYDGRLPLLIKALPEGTAVPTNNALMTIENTDPNVPWLTNYLETVLSQIWAPSTVATLSYAIRGLLVEYLEQSSDRPEAALFQLHDFGYRGVTSPESAAIEGAGHLINFLGTDTFAAVDLILDYYSKGLDNAYMPSFSVPATEHSVMTALGRDGEMEILGQLLDTYPAGILSVVIDSYNYQDFIKNAATRFKDKIESRQPVLAPNGDIIAPAKLVFRPDSGEPVATSEDVFRRLAQYFGRSVNSKGYKVLNPYVGMLWGDGIDMDGIVDICDNLVAKKISVDNIVFGMGGGLLQKIDRDTQRFAFKSSYQVRSGIGYNIQKDPMDQSKKSKKGRLAVVKDSLDTIRTLQEVTGDITGDLLEPVFLNGELLKDINFEAIRANSNV